MTEPVRARRELQLLGEVTLALVTVAAVLSLRRVFQDGSFLRPVLTTAITAHVLAVACRRVRLPGVVTAAVALVSGALVVTWMRLGDTTSYGLPTGATWQAVRDQLHEAGHVFGQVMPPAPVLPGFVLGACAGVWIVAFVADAAAYRARAQLEAIIPGTTLFVFSGALGTGSHRLDIAALFVGAVLAHWLVQRALAATSSATWLAPEGGGGTPSLLRVGAVIAAVGVVAAVVVGPNLPGADAKSIIPWRATDRKQPDARVTISPLVDIRSRLVEQADTIVFTVKSTQRTYWRLTSLERFDGRIWSSNRQYRPATGTLGNDVTDDSTTTTAREDFTIAGLSSIWLPAAFRPVRVSGTKARYDSDSNSLLTDEDTTTNLRYSVTSALPSFTKPQLESVAPVAPRKVADEYTSLPGDFSIPVQRLAGRIVSGARTQYDKAKALQDYFRSGEFTYDLNVQPGHSGRDLENFLFRTRRGYCEQFAGAYAAMARAVGLPARVAVGFTPGEYDPATGSYTVRGYNGHAWPEVYLDGFGWVPFEPTPGRGMPGATAWTGVPESQASAQNPNTATTLPNQQAPAQSGGTTTTTAPSTTTTAVGQAHRHSSSPWPGRIAMAVAVVLGLPLVWMLALLVWRTIRRRRRRSAASTPEARVLVAWDEAAEALARAGAPPNPWETPTEFAVRAAGATGVDRRLLMGLAGLTTHAVYGGDGVQEAAAQQAVEVAGTIEEQADAVVGRRTRLRRLVVP